MAAGGRGGRAPSARGARAARLAGTPARGDGTAGGERRHPAGATALAPGGERGGGVGEHVGRQ
eukprot:1977091-Pleurochrysis_carterae.AAC.1